MYGIITRDKWRARAPRRIEQVAGRQRTGFAVHHSGADARQTVRSIQDFHMDVKKWSDVGYNFLIDPDGLIYEGRGWWRLGTHAAGANTASIGVCLIGDYDDDLPSVAARGALQWLYDVARREFRRPLIAQTHRMLGRTECPGDALHRWVLSTLGNTTMPPPSRPPATTPPTMEGDLMFPKKGDSGPAVGYRQRQLIAVGEQLPKYGVDEDYGTETTAAVASFYRKISGGKTYHGRQVTTWIALELDKRVFGATASVDGVAAELARRIQNG